MAAPEREPDMPLIAPKETLLSIGNYEILHKIADGGMGSVYRGRNRTTKEIVAIKIISSRSGMAMEVLLKRLEQEFWATCSINHPHLVRALDFGKEGPTTYLVLEFVDGE